MLHTEYVKNLNCNYERILLEEKPEENRYQYCIVGRGGIKRLLPCSLRYINNEAYLYYDISSTQSLSQFYAGKSIKREWIKDFLWTMKQIRIELERFLLDESNLLWYPEQIFQDLEKKDFFFLYIPYYNGESGFQELLDFLVEHVDYEDDVLVECIYTFYEQYKAHGEVYLKEQIFEDARQLDAGPAEKALKTEEEGFNRRAGGTQTVNLLDTADTGTAAAVFASTNMTRTAAVGTDMADVGEEYNKPKKGLLYFLENRRKKQQEERAHLQKQTEEMTAACAVAEMTPYTAFRQETKDDYEEEMGKTVYMEEQEENKVYYLFTREGMPVYALKKDSVIIGKMQGEADCILSDNSVSRIHARITKEREEFYVEDLNSTNGTFKNGLRLQPYEKRKLAAEDEIRLGKTILIFR